MKPVLILLLRGAVIGLAALMPGFSAATMAFAIGSFQPILQALGSLNIQAFKYWHGKKWRELEAHVQWKMLLLMPMGAALTYFVAPLFLPLNFWMAEYKPIIYAGFCGLLLGGLGCTLWSHRGGGFLGLLLFIGGITASLVLLMLPIQPLPAEWPFLLLHGIVFMATHLLPGISGAFADRPLADLNAVAYYADHGYWPALVLFALGLFLGLIAMIMLLSWAYRRASEKTVSLLMGLIVGTLIQLWPLRYLQHNTPDELTFVGGAFVGGIVLSALLQFFQRRTLA